jgi:hypothetical protein
MNLRQKKEIECQQPVIVKTVASDGGSATIAFPSDPTYETKIYFTNCTGTKLVSGQKVYLHHNFDNPSQGWLVSNQISSYAAGTVSDIRTGATLTDTFVKQVGNIVCVGTIATFYPVIKDTAWSFSLAKIGGVVLPKDVFYFPVAYQTNNGYWAQGAWSYFLKWNYCFEWFTAFWFADDICYF